MSFLIHAVLHKSTPSTSLTEVNTTNVKVLTGSQKCLLTTDLVLSILAIGAGGVVLLNIHGTSFNFIPYLSAIGSNYALGLMGAGGAVIILDLSHYAFMSCKAYAKRKLSTPKPVETEVPFDQLLSNFLNNPTSENEKLLLQTEISEEPLAEQSKLTHALQNVSDHIDETLYKTQEESSIQDYLFSELDLLCEDMEKNINKEEINRTQLENENDRKTEKRNLTEVIKETPSKTARLLEIQNFDISRLRKYTPPAQMEPPQSDTLISSSAESPPATIETLVNDGEDWETGQEDLSYNSEKKEMPSITNFLAKLDFAQLLTSPVNIEKSAESPTSYKFQIHDEKSVNQVIKEEIIENEILQSDNLPPLDSKVRKLFSQDTNGISLTNNRHSVTHDRNAIENFLEYLSDKIKTVLKNDKLTFDAQEGATGSWKKILTTPVDDDQLVSYVEKISQDVDPEAVNQGLMDYFHILAEWFKAGKEQSQILLRLAQAKLEMEELLKLRTLKK